MGEALIVQKNINSNEEVFATIKVTYPSGSTCTCTNGDKILTDTNTNGTVIFAIPDAGTWTVSCTDGSMSSSQSVSVTAEGQSKSVALSYIKYLFNNGSTVPWSAVSTSSYCIINTRLGIASVSGTTDKTMKVSTTNKIDITKYSKLCFNIVSSSSQLNRATFAVSSNQTATDGVLKKTKVSSNGTFSLDISGLSGSYYVCFSNWGYGSGIAFQIDKVWLEP